MLRFFPLLIFPLLGFLIFALLVKSPRFSRMCAKLSGQAEDSDLIATLDAAEELATVRITESQRLAEKAKRNAEFLRNRIRRPE